MDKIKILVINPNATVSATEGILTAARAYANGEFEVDAVGNPDGPAFVDGPADRIAAAPGMEKILRANVDKYDAFVVACHCDPNADLLRSITDKPVIGIGGASIYGAAMLGLPFSVVTTSEGSYEEKLAQVKRMGLGDIALSVRYGFTVEGEENTMADRMLRGARVAVEEDGAKALVLAITGFPGLAEGIEEKLGVRVLDSLACAIFAARDHVAYRKFLK